MNEGYGPKGDGQIRPGDWVWDIWDSGKKRVPVRVVEVGDKLRVEHWEVAKLTRRTVAFGQRIDKTPYRVGGMYMLALDEVQLMPPVLARQRQVEYERIMRYPTKGQRDYARAKRRRERVAR